jgi:predicted DNA-binding transcriptional regulator AlpA
MRVPVEAKMITNTPTADRFISLPELERIVGFKRSTIYRRAGKDFPLPIRTGPNRVAWLASDVDRWMAETVAASREQQAAA